MTDKPLQSWADSVPHKLVPAVKHLRDKFVEANAGCFSVTISPCYALLHPEDIAAVGTAATYELPMQILATFIGKSATLTSGRLLKRETAPATFEAFFHMCREAIKKHVKQSFDALLAIAHANAAQFKPDPIAWAKSQTKNMFESPVLRLQLRDWVKHSCDRQSPGAGLDGVEILYWHTWRAPQFLLMEPCGAKPYVASLIWERLDESLTLTLLRSFDDVFVFGLNMRLDDLAGKAHVKSAIAGKTQTVSRQTPKKPVKQAIQIRQAAIWGAIEAGYKGPEYCRSLDRKSLAVPQPWKDEGCPATYSAAYRIGDWKKRIQDEKCRFRLRYEATPVAERSAIISGTGTRRTRR